MTDGATTRRAFLGSAAALAAGAVVPGRLFEMTRCALAKPYSVFNGVRIGCISYSYRGEHQYGGRNAQGPD